MVQDRQVRKLHMLKTREETLGAAASKSGMDEKTARKYVRSGKLPSQSKITHPFHPFSGQRFELVSNRWSWGQEWIYFYDDEGRLRSVPVDWTSLCAPDLFIILANGRAKFRPEDLFRLAELIDKISGSGQEQSSRRLLGRGS